MGGWTAGSWAWTAVATSTTAMNDRWCFSMRGPRDVKMRWICSRRTTASLYAIQVRLGPYDQRPAHHRGTGHATRVQGVGGEHAEDRTGLDHRSLAAGV